MLTIELTREKVFRNKHEWRYQSVATLKLPSGETFTAQTEDTSIRKVARECLAQRPDLGGVLVEVTRDGRKVLTPRKLALIPTGNAWTSTGEEQPEWLKRK